MKGYLRLVRDLRTALGRRPAVVYQILGTNPTGLARDLTSIHMASARGIPVVAQVRGGHFVAFFRDLPRSAQRLILSGLGKLSRLLVEGGSIRDTFEGIVPLDEIELVRHPVADVTEARPTRVLFVGHRSAAKGWLDLLRALDDLCAPAGGPGGDWRLTAIGTRVTRERNVPLPTEPETDSQAEIDGLEAALTGDGGERVGSYCRLPALVSSRRAVLDAKRPGKHAACGPLRWQDRLTRPRSRPHRSG